MKIPLPVMTTPVPVESTTTEAAETTPTTTPTTTTTSEPVVLTTANLEGKYSLNKSHKDVDYISIKAGWSPWRGFIMGRKNRTKFEGKGEK